MTITIEQLLKRTWRNEMSSGRGLDSYSNYSGPEPEIADWVWVVSRGRDSDLVTESNWDVALEMLGGKGRHVKVEQFGHWGCGWFEILCVNPASKRKLKVALEIVQCLEQYPLLDDSDYSERENQYCSEYAEDAKERLAEALAEHFGLKVTKALKELAYQLNMECQRYNGPDSCINIYSGRKPDRRDLRQLKDCLERLDVKGSAYLKLCKAVGVAA
jgi:hypothetical protein